MLKTILSVLLVVTAFSCSGPRYVDYFPYHDDGRTKPKVVLLPIIDSTNSKFPWNVSDELSQCLYYELMNSGELYVMPPEECGAGWQQRENIDFFATDLSFVQNFGNADFLVAMELIEHSVLPSQSCCKGTSNTPDNHPFNHNLCARVRIKVIDMRCDQPRIALYEIVKGDFATAPPYDQVDYEKNCWGNKGYYITPCATVHQRLISNLALRLEQVICTAR